MFNLEAASRPIMMTQNSPPDEGFEEQSSDSRERVKYCDIAGLRIILSGDLCSDDHIQIVDNEGNLMVDAVGNLRFGMGFGDALGGIAFFDAFDTAWKIDTPSNPFAGSLDLARIVVAPVETRFDIEDRFYAMRYGTRPSQRKEWHYHTTSLTLDFATQGMATKPYAVTRGEIRPSLTHENMGGDPYAEVRFMVSAETPLGAGTDAGDGLFGHGDGLCAGFTCRG